ncbi:lipopolysaccharide core biosynthesis protein [Pseudomonas sp. 1928-m]|uniref:lipopolysaccharide core biosynthesis protein n=1 Tax=Pseudomonas sp. 1928-m TaxID=3033804 RepID=UPI0023DFA7F9|nr:lipopolysaccharide core biosynthesis protein [Pseudomonas sp. 1928-m]MDF3193742.1 lipopolysaccharide core biosynthesis protein [Pseudomonas sp. 1928-m]
MNNPVVLDSWLCGLWDEGRKFQQCKGIHSGPVIIFASGPSAAQFPLERYAHVPFITMNGAIARFSQTAARPLFYLCDDQGFVRERRQLVLEGIRLSSHAALGANALKVLMQASPDIVEMAKPYLMLRVNRPLSGTPLSDRQFAWNARGNAELECGFSLFERKPNRIGFSRNMALGYFGGRTIPYAAVQLAFHLGFDHVFLVGMDLNAQAGRFYEQADEALPSRLDDDYKDYILPSFQLMAKRVVGENFQVFNLSIDSRMPTTVVPKIDLAQFEALLARS